jgi:hypothetical protein
MRWCSGSSDAPSKPFGQIVDALKQLESGRFDVSLPALNGIEANTIGAAFNRMVGVLGTQLETEKRALRAESQLSDSRELARWVDHHIEQERRTIARELHDELGSRSPRCAAWRCRWRSVCARTTRRPKPPRARSPTRPRACTTRCTA